MAAIRTAMINRTAEIRPRLRLSPGGDLSEVRPADKVNQVKGDYEGGSWKRNLGMPHA